MLALPNGGPGQLALTNISMDTRGARLRPDFLLLTRALNWVLRFKGVPTHIYKTAVRSLHLIYIAVLARTDLRGLLVKYPDTPFRLNPPVPTESLPTA